MSYILVPLDERAKYFIPSACEVDSDTYYHYFNAYHGEFVFIRFDFYEGGSVYIDEVYQSTSKLNKKNLDNFL